MHMQRLFCTLVCWDLCFWFTIKGGNYDKTQKRQHASNTAAGIIGPEFQNEAKCNNKTNPPKKDKHTSPWSQRLSCSWPRQCERLSEPGPCEPSPVNAGSPTYKRATTQWTSTPPPGVATVRWWQIHVQSRTFKPQVIGTKICILVHLI